MRKLILTGWMMGVLALTTVCFAGSAPAQETPKEQHSAEASKPAEKQVSVYRLEFVVRELEEGKKINSRAYIMSVEDGDVGRIRVGNKVPFSSGKDQYQYFDVGINIDCRLRDHGSYILLENTSIEISSVVKDETAANGTPNSTPNPIMRQARTTVAAAVTPGKPAVIASMDDVSSNHRYEVEVTATKVK